MNMMSDCCVLMWMFLVSDRQKDVKNTAVSSLSELSLISLRETHYSSICLSFYRETDRSQIDMWKNPLSCSSSASVREETLPSSLPLCRKVTACLIGINQLAAPVEWRRRDLKRNSIDPQREVYTAAGLALVPIHLPQHNIIIPNSTTEEEGASLGFLGQEQKAREREKKLN